MALPHSKTRNATSGMSVIEIVIGAALILSGLLGMIGAYATYVKYALQNSSNAQAAYLLEEALEAVSLVRDAGWASNIAPLSTTTPYFLSFNGTSWTLTATPQYVDGVFLRTIEFDDVTRDSGDAIASAGTFDPGSRLVTATVSYFVQHATTTVSASAYIMDIYGN